MFLSDRLSRTAGPARWAVLGVELLTTTAVLAVLAACLGDWSGLPSLRPADAGLIVGVGWGASLVPAAIGLRFQQYVSPVTVEFIYALEPVMGALAGRWLLGEVLTPLGWASGALLLTGAVLHAWPAPVASPRPSNCAPSASPKRWWWAASLAVGLGISGAAAAQSPEPTPTQVSARLDYDSFFGFYPTLSITRTLDSLRLLTVYGSYYAQCLVRKKVDRFAVSPALC